MDNRPKAADLLRRIESGEREPTLKTEVTEFTKVTAGELRSAAYANPEHPNAEIFVRGVLGALDKKKVTVVTVDLVALLRNLTAEEFRVGPNRWEKRLGPERMTGTAVDAEMAADILDDSPEADEPIEGSSSGNTEVFVSDDADQAPQADNES